MEKRKIYILLEDCEGYVNINRLALGLPPKPTRVPVLKGELLQALPQGKQPEERTRIALAGIEREDLYLECGEKDVRPINEEKLLLALYPAAVGYPEFLDRQDVERQAVQSKSSLRRIMEETFSDTDTGCSQRIKQLQQEIEIGQRVITFIKDVRTSGTVRYIGEEKDSRDDIRKIVGLELDEKRGKGNGKLKKKQLFICKKDHAVFVGIETIIPEKKPSHGIPGEAGTTADGQVTLPIENDLRIIQEKLSQKESLETGRFERICKTEFENQDLEKRLTRMEQQLTDCQGQLAIKVSQEKRFQEQLREYQNQLTAKETQVEHVQTQLRELQEQFLILKENKERETSCLEDKLQTKVKELDDLQRELRDKVQDIVQLQRDLSAAEETLVKYEPQLKTRDWVLSRDDVELTDKCLGEGGWGIVLEGRYCDCSVAIKKLKESTLTPQALCLFEREMDIASRCRHPCLLLFIGAITDKSCPLIVTELMELSLRALLGKRQLSEREVSVISLDVARALNYLHQRKPKPIVHRDVSSGNVLLWKKNDQWRGKLSDYGTAKVLQEIMTRCPGAMSYAAPESRSSFDQTVKIDVYSFGVLLNEMCLNGELPDPERREEQVKRVKNKGFGKLILWCIEDDPEMRPTMTEVIEELNRLML